MTGLIEEGECSECGRPDNELTDRGRRFIRRFIGGSAILTGSLLVMAAVADASSTVNSLAVVWIGGEILLVPASYYDSLRAE